MIKRLREINISQLDKKQFKKEKTEEGNCFVCKNF